ncbi:MAG: hypothetical protein AAF329_12760, partial [Cyanobacteria bacterium P01_A01_bin.17]
MPNAFLLLSTALVMAIAGYLLNQLPEVPNIPNRNRLVIRLFLYFSLFPVFFDLLSKNTESKFRVCIYIAIFSLVAGVVRDGWIIIKSWLHHYPHIESSLDPNLRERFLQEFRSKVMRRLQYIEEQQVLINLQMQDASDAINLL